MPEDIALDPVQSEIWAWLCPPVNNFSEQDIPTLRLLTYWHAVAEQAQQFYAELKAAGVDVLFDDRKERPGVMFADMELIGVPHAIVIGDRGLDNGVVEYKCRRSGEKQEVAIKEIVALLKAKLGR